MLLVVQAVLARADAGNVTETAVTMKWNLVTGFKDSLQHGGVSLPQEASGDIMADLSIKPGYDIPDSLRRLCRVLVAAHGAHQYSARLLTPLGRTPASGTASGCLRYPKSALPKRTCSPVRRLATLHSA